MGKKSKEKSKKRNKNRNQEDNEEATRVSDHAEVPVFVNRTVEMPDGAAASDGDDNDDDRKTGDEEDTHRALRNINLDDIDGIRSQQTFNFGQNGNGEFGTIEEIKDGKEKKKKKH